MLTLLHLHISFELAPATLKVLYGVGISFELSLEKLSFFLFVLLAYFFFVEIVLYNHFRRLSLMELADNMPFSSTAVMGDLNAST